MPYIGTPAVDRFTSTKSASVFSGDGSTTAFTLEQAVVQDEDILVSVDGVIQEPSVAYAVSNGTTLTFTGAPSNDSGNNIFVYYLASQVGTVGHPSNQALSATSGTFTGNVIIPDAGNIGSASDTDAIAISSGGVVTFSQTPVGAFISMVDQFRLTANTSANTNAVITANLERVDDASFSKVGSGMTESSGIFTFPTTGVYQVICNPMIDSRNDSNSYVITGISTDSGSSFDTIAVCNGGSAQNTALSANSVCTIGIVNVTNSSTFRARFETSSMGSNSFVEGNTDANYSSFTFIRLGESQ